MRITSAYKNNTAPAPVARWEGLAEAAATDEAAHVQLTYEVLVQLRWLRLLLFGVFVLVPVIAIIAMVVLSSVGADTGSTF